MPDLDISSIAGHDTSSFTQHSRTKLTSLLHSIFGKNSYISSNGNEIRFSIFRSNIMHFMIPNYNVASVNRSKNGITTPR